MLDMNTSEELREEERRSIETERAAFERWQNAVNSLSGQFQRFVNGVPIGGSGQPTDVSLREEEEARAAWEAADAEMKRIGAEIRTGKR
jgi:hypothetical protein